MIASGKMEEVPKGRHILAQYEVLGYMEILSDESCKDGILTIFNMSYFQHFNYSISHKPSTSYRARICRPSGT